MSVLLDTCVVIWLGQVEPIAESALEHIEAARRDGGALVSAVSAWELGLAATRDKRPMAFLPDVATWLGRLMASPGLRTLPLHADVALASNHLPGWTHRDPADRFRYSMTVRRDG